MSRKKPIKIKLEKDIIVSPDYVFKSSVVKSGNGAVIKSYKQFIGYNCIVIIIGNEEIISTNNKINKKIADKYYKCTY